MNKNGAHMAIRTSIRQYLRERERVSKMGVEVSVDEADKKRQDPRGGYDPFEVRNKKPGYRYRLINKNQRNIERKTAEGWDLVQGNDLRSEERRVGKECRS